MITSKDNIKKCLFSEFASSLIKHLYQIIQIFSMPFGYQPFFKISLKGTVKVPSHLLRQFAFCYFCLKIVIISVSVLQLFYILGWRKDIFLYILFLPFLLVLLLTRHD